MQMRPFTFLPSLSPTPYQLASSEAATSLSFRPIREPPEDSLSPEQLRSLSCYRVLRNPSLSKGKQISLGSGCTAPPSWRITSDGLKSRSLAFPITVSKGEASLISTSDWQNMNARTSIDWGTSQRKLYRYESTERSTFSFLCYFSDLESVMTVQSYISIFLSHTNDKAAVCTFMNSQGEYIVWSLIYLAVCSKAKPFATFGCWWLGDSSSTARAEG